MSLVPGMGIVRGMGLTLKRFFQPKATIRYPEVRADVAPKFRGRLQLLYDEYGTLKCETCFQCAQACPIECIDMGGIDTKGRFHVHWGAPETYGERREESAIRRSGRPVADAAFRRFDPVDTRAAGRHPRAPRLRPEAPARDPRGDAGRVRLPAGRRAQAHQPRDRRLVRVRSTGPRPTTATSGSSRRRSPPCPPRARRTSRSSTGYRSALDASLGYAGRAELMAQFLKTPKEWPAVLTGRAAALAADPSDLDARDPRRRVRRAAQGRPRPRRRPAPSRPSRSSGLRGRGGGGFPTGEKWRAAAERAGEPALRRRQRLRRGPVRAHRRDAPRRRPVERSSRASRSPRSRSARPRRSSPSAPRTRRSSRCSRARSSRRRRRASWARTSSGSGYRDRR